MLPVLNITYIPADVDGWAYIAELVLGDVLLLLLLVLVMEEVGTVVDDSDALCAASEGSDGGRGIDDDRWSSAMGARWVWSEIVVI